jgi:hypothetical protein
MANNKQVTLLLFHVIHPGTHLPHHYVGFRLNKRMVYQEKRSEATYENGNSMYNDPSRNNVMLAGTQHDAPPSYAAGMPHNVPKNPVNQFEVELGRIER